MIDQQRTHRLVRQPARQALAALALAFAGATHAQDFASATVSDPGAIDRVVIYPTSAAVTRVIHKDLTQGLWTIRVTNLPEGVVGSQLQAKVRSGDAPGPSTPRLLGVEYEETPGIDFAGSPEGAALAERLKDAKQRLGFLGIRERALTREIPFNKSVIEFRTEKTPRYDATGIDKVFNKIIWLCHRLA